MEKKIYYTMGRLKTAYRSGKIAVISASGCVVKFMFKNDPDTVGYLVTSGDAIRRFESDDIAWSVIDIMKNDQ
ncbi:MAG: hypothetical protein GY820_07200 [Gammaproteobacteria bacterium]|nr:hypothetical protein [Gammaproteobacteria bacterium]